MGTSSLTRKAVWQRSLYWRIVLGFAACIAGVLAAQTMAVLLLLKTVPDGQRLTEFTQGVAGDLSAALQADPDINVQRYIDRRYPKPLASLYIIIERNAQVILRGPN